MTSCLLDTNVLIRFLVGDHPAHQQQAVVWFKEAEGGQRKIVVTSLVIAETSFVLESFYQHSRQEIADALEIFISQRWLEIPDRQVLLGLMPYYRQDLHFVDSFLLSWIKINQAQVLTFDEEIKKRQV